MIHSGNKQRALMLPPSNKLSICFAHVAYQLHERFAARDTGIVSFARIADLGDSRDHRG